MGDIWGDPEEAGLCRGVVRRDVIRGGLAGSGLLLLPACRGRDGPPPSAWDGPGGVGEYAASNGYTEAVVRAGHRIRDGAYADVSQTADDTGERPDLVVMGGGFAGLGAALEYRRRFPDGRVLVLDNQTAFGGYAKANEFDVDGLRVAGGQATLNFLMPETEAQRADAYWDVLGLPERFAFAGRTGGDPSIVFARGTSTALYHGEQAASTGYFFKEEVSGRVVRDVWRDDLARAPWPPKRRRQRCVAG